MRAGQRLRRLVKVAMVAAMVVLCGMAVGPGVAHAQFAGRDGLLAVQPTTTGSGVVLVSSGGKTVRTVCGAQGVSSACVVDGTPRFSPDGRELMIDGAYPIELDLHGGCVDCSLNNITSTRAPVFAYRAGGDLTVLRGAALRTINSAGVFAALRSLPVPRGVTLSSDDWSSRGELAASGNGRVWIFDAGSRRFLGQGSNPSWSPNGKQLVLSRGSVIALISATTGRLVARLGRGSRPVFSPDGRHVAFIAADHRVEIASIHGGPARAVDSVTGRSVSWQPLPRTVRSNCETPSVKSQAISGAGSPLRELITSPVSAVFMPCTSTDRIERVLATTQAFVGRSISFNDVIANGRYALITSTDGAGSQLFSDLTSADEFDLTRSQLISSHDLCQYGDELSGDTPECYLQSAVLAPDGVYATLTQFGTDTINVYQGDTESEIDSSNVGNGEPALSDLSLDGQTLSWLRGTAPESTVLP